MINVQFLNDNSSQQMLGANIIKSYPNMWGDVCSVMSSSLQLHGL